MNLGIYNKDINLYIDNMRDTDECVRTVSRYIEDKLENVRNNREYDFYNNLIFDVLDENENTIGQIKQIGYSWYFEDENTKYNKQGVQSLLPPNLYHLVRSAEFKNWFGDWENDPENASKVVDRYGEPLIVYHGTQRSFDVFDASKNRGSGLKEQWHCFTSNKKLAQFYASVNGDPGDIMPVFLNIRDMPVLDGKQDNWRNTKYDMSYKEGNIHDVKDAFFNGNTSAGITQKDGFCVRNVIEDDSFENNYERMGDTYYVRNSNQIKSITNASFTQSPSIYEHLKY